MNTIKSFFWWEGGLLSAMNEAIVRIRGDRMSFVQGLVELENFADLLSAKMMHQIVLLSFVFVFSRWRRLQC